MAGAAFATGLGGLAGDVMVAVGANFYHYIEMPYLQHIQYHQIYGCKGFSYNTANINFWQILISLM